jgi:hypothetical protein
MSRIHLWAGVVVIVVAAGWALATLATELGPPEVQGDEIDVYNPVEAGEALPEGFRQLLPRDAIAPVYDPEFVIAANADWSDRVQVIGIAVDGQAKAYPVSFLNRREMVIDQLDGIPLLVSW